MNIVQITPGAGGMYCGNCLRDNALVSELRKMGHNTLMVPLYLPLTLDEDNQCRNTPIFFGGINVYLEQKFPWFQKMPHWFRKALASPVLLKWASGRAAKTKAEEVGDITLSMFQGEQGNQAQELDELVTWLKEQMKPDILCLSNAMLLGLARNLKKDLNCRICCMLTGEDSFLDGLPIRYRDKAWNLLSERAADADLFVAPTDYFAQRMISRLRLKAEKVKVVHNGLNLSGYPAQPESNVSGAVVGFFARMCKDKGLDLLVDAVIKLHRRGQIPDLRLKIGGGCGPADESFVADQKEKLSTAGFLDRTEFHPNLSRDQKVDFLKSLTVFSVPALYGESFGLYLLEAMAVGLPVVQPKAASFPEIIAATEGGLLAEPTAEGLAEQLEILLTDRALLTRLGTTAYQAVHSRFTMRDMAENMLAAWTKQ